MKTPGQIAYEAFYRRNAVNITWAACSDKAVWEQVAAAVLAAQWRRYDTEPPPIGMVFFSHHLGNYWMPIPPLPTTPEPTPGERERAEFEEQARSGIFTNFEQDAHGRYSHPFLQCRWEGWQAARKSKEASK